MSQPDSVWVAYKMQFKKNVVELGNLYCWSDNNFFPGTLKLTTETNFNSDFENYQPGLFQDISVNAEDFYLFLDSMNSNEKQHLIRYFSFLEKYFDTTFESAQLPPDFKYLAPAFSAMNQKLIEPKSKAGIWQLNHFQAVLNGLQINQLVDERFNPWLSTQAFTKEIKQNLSLFSSPELAVLAYVFGKTKVKNALAFAGENATLSQIIVYLPESANHLISNFQAISVFLKVNRFTPKNEPLAKIVQPDTVKITKQVHFKQISFVLGIEQEELEFLNPQFRFLIVPKSATSSKLAVPNGYWDDFVLWQDSVYSTFDSTLFNITVQKIEYPPAPDRQYAGEPVKNLEIEGKTKIRYTLQSGDVLGIIAEKYDVKVADLKYWNNISNERRIQAGKTLDIFIDNAKVEYYSGLQKSNKQIEAKSEIVNQFNSGSPLASYQPKNKGRKVEHTVKSGESPFTIAKKYEGVTPEDILIWNNIKDARKIQIGQKLIVYEK
jgi:membrane-bound lytic murein transglycosylase D